MDNRATDPAIPPGPETVPNPLVPVDPAAGPDPDVEMRLRDFVILRTLGAGGMGIVYLAEDRKLGRKVAVKRMRPELALNPTVRARFQQEARTAAAVESDFVVPILQIGEADDGTPFFAMPYLRGETLEARLTREGVLPLGEVLHVARDAADGLAAAHAKGVIHRDVKPGNIWVECGSEATGPDGPIHRCKLLDFGLARPLLELARLTASGVMIGTIGYMAPEQARGEPVDARADLFSLGAVLYRMSTGRLPFAGPNTIAILAAIATTVPAPVRAINPGVPAPLSELIDRLLAKDPAGRPAGAAEVAVALRQIIAATESPTVIQPISPAQPVSPGPPEFRRPGRRRWLWVAAGLLALPWLWRILSADRHGPGEAGPPAGPAAPLPPEVAATAADAHPDRDAAEWVVSVGGTVLVNHRTDFLKTAAEFPPGPFRLTHVNLIQTPRVRDDDLARLGRCDELTGVDLRDSGITGSGLKHLNRCKRLTALVLNGEAASDRALGGLDAPEELESLGLGGEHVTDAGLGRFGRCKKLKILHLGGTAVGDAGVAAVQDCRDVRSIDLWGTRVTDAGLAPLTGWPKLYRVSLRATRVTDAGAERLKGCPSLTDVDVAITAVTAEKVQDLHRALPKCKIIWSGGTVKPAD